jgi:DNA processing protein
VSIIGSRRVPEEARRFTRELSATLARAGWSVVSGGAMGIDAAAHEGALDAGRPTWAVVTGALDGEPYPPEHGALFDAMLAAGGGLVSLEPDGARRAQYQFLHRNVVMVAMTQATIVVHAKAGGGATKAAKAARKLGRPLFFTPAPPWCRSASGTLRALQSGAEAVWSIGDAIARIAPFATATPTDLAPDERTLWNAASHEALHTDELAARSALDRERAAEALLMLVLDGHLVEGPPGHYRRAREL